jgi:hypothetical protein
VEVVLVVGQLHLPVLLVVQAVVRQVTQVIQLVALEHLVRVTQVVDLGFKVAIILLVVVEALVQLVELQ